jgi:hypothetical protein
VVYRQSFTLLGSWRGTLEDSKKPTSDVKVLLRATTGFPPNWYEKWKQESLVNGSGSGTDCIALDLLVCVQQWASERLGLAAISSQQVDIEGCISNMRPQH